MSGPALSVVLATVDTAASLRLTLRYLKAQTVRDQIEMVLVGPARAALEPAAPWLEGFWGHQMVEAGPVRSIARANARGVRASRAPLVALAEDHCFPDAEWAEALIAAHQAGDHAVVGPVFRNGNPRTAVSWCDFLVGYGPWMEGAAAGRRPFLAGHNSCYRREVLLGLGERLEERMESETVLHLEWARAGYSLYLEPKAKAAHTNFGLLESWLAVQYHNGRVFGASRAKDWSAAKRVAFACAAPLIPVVRWVRCARYLLGRRGWESLAVQVLPLLFWGLLIDGAGQFGGMLFGAGDAIERAAEYEFQRFRHVPPEDQEEAERAAP